MEADAAKQRINELKKSLVQKRRKEMQQAHQHYKEELENSHNQEYNQFNAFWDQRMSKFEEEAKQVELELIERQEAVYRQLAEELDRLLPYKPKESSEVLNLKKIEEHLAKQKKYSHSLSSYVEAH